MEPERDAGNGDEKNDNYENPGYILDLSYPVDKAKPEGIEENAAQKPNPPWYRRRWFRKATSPMGLYTLGLLVVAGVQVWVTKRQLDEMVTDSIQTDNLINATKSLAEAADKNAKAAQTAAQAATDQVALSRQQLESTSAAIIVFQRPFIFDRRGHRVMLTFNNVGHSPATSIKASITVTLNAIPSQVKVATHSFEIAVPILYQPSVNESSDRRARFSWEHGYSFTPIELGKLDNGEAALLAELSISYDNGFRVISDKTCYASIGFGPHEVRRDASGVETVQYVATPLCPELASHFEPLADAMRKYQVRLDALRQNKNK